MEEDSDEKCWVQVHMCAAVNGIAKRLAMILYNLRVPALIAMEFIYIRRTPVELNH